MSVATHTPGKWEVVFDGVEYTVCAFEGDPKEGIMLDCVAEMFGTNDKADAHLIAASPDMLEALHEAKGLADMAEMHDGPGEPSPDQQALIALRGKIDAAISKALGDQQ